MATLEQIRNIAPAGTQIPKPRSEERYLVVRYGESRGEPALVYQLSTRPGTGRASEKRIPASVFTAAEERLRETGEISRAWFREQFPVVDGDGTCNFTTLGGLLELAGEVRYVSDGVYKRTDTT